MHRSGPWCSRRHLLTRASSARGQHTLGRRQTGDSCPMSCDLCSLRFVLLVSCFNAIYRLRWFEPAWNLHSCPFPLRPLPFCRPTCTFDPCPLHPSWPPCMMQLGRKDPPGRKGEPSNVCAIGQSGNKQEITKKPE